MSDNITPLPQGAGYAVVVGLGFSLPLVWLQPRLL